MTLENYLTKIFIKELVHGISHAIADLKQAAWKYGGISTLHQPSYSL